MTSAIATAFMEAEAKAGARTQAPIACACAFEVVISEVDPRVGYLREARRIWFDHMRAEHPEQYAKIGKPRRRVRR